MLGCEGCKEAIGRSSDYIWENSLGQVPFRRSLPDHKVKGDPILLVHFSNF